MLMHHTLEPAVSV